MLITKHALLSINTTYPTTHLTENFCGKVFSDVESFNKYCTPDIIVYLCGNIDEILSSANLAIAAKVYVIKELSRNYQLFHTSSIITLGEVPINIHNVGVYFRKFFRGKDYYESITSEHKFQDLGMSGSQGKAYRKGIYLTKVEQTTFDNNEEVKFKLLRCSTNLNGPTDNFRSTDVEIIDKVNTVRHFFDGAELNHVLAQTYHNHFDKNQSPKQRKAKISEHSDKTKDMPANGLMAFCSFYKDLPDQQTTCKYSGDSFDYVYGKGVTILTKLRFRLKAEAAIADPTLTKHFDITLYPNSIFLISLLTNRIYTHEIVPSDLPINKIPTRMGYVIRCSNTDAVFKDNQTYIISHGHNIKLDEITRQGFLELKDLYYKENTSTYVIDYKDKFFFSMNSGDYLKPLL